MHEPKHLVPLLCAAALLASAAQAQTITPLIVQGDTLPLGSVTSIYDVDVNGRGDWLAEVATNGGPTSDNAVVFNGTMIHHEGTDLGFPPSHVGAWFYDDWVDSMDVNDEGDRLVLMNVADVSGTQVDKKLLLWTSGSTGTTHVLMEERVTPNTVAGEPAGAAWLYIEEAWQNNNDTIVVTGRSDADSDDMMAVITHDGAGTILGQTVFVIDGVVHSTAFPGSTGVHADTVQTLAPGKQAFAINDAGQKMFYVDDESFGSGGSPDYTAVDSHYYVDLQEILWENTVAPTGAGVNFGHFQSVEVDINDAGDWVAACNDTDYTGVILLNGAPFAVQGSTTPGVPGGFALQGTAYTNGGVQISEFGDLTWSARWSDPDTSRNEGVFRNHELLVQKGVTKVGGLLVTELPTSSGGEVMAVSDNGLYIIKELELEGGIEGAYMIELPLAEYFCLGDGSDVTCPCGNLGGAGEGCQNSAGSGAALEVTGSVSVSADNMVLLSTGSPADKPGVFFQGDALENGGLGLPFGDGVRCVGGNIQRFGVVVTDGSGAASTAYGTIPANAAMSGDTRQYQWWYRDPNGGPCSSGFNVSNAAEVTWAP